MAGVNVVAQILGSPTFLCGESLCCEVKLTTSYPQQSWTIRHLKGLALGQYRLNVASLAHATPDTKLLPAEVVKLDEPVIALPDGIFAEGLDPQSKVSWASPMHTKCSGPPTITADMSSLRFTLKTRLPENLPPSYRGNILRVAYKLVIALKPDRQSPHFLLHLPFRVLPSVNAYSLDEPVFSASVSTITPGLTSYCDSNYTGDQCGPDFEGNPFRWESEGTVGGMRVQRCLGDGGLSKDGVHPAIYGKLSQLYAEAQSTDSHVSLRKKKSNNRRQRGFRKASPSRSPSAMFAEIISSDSMVTFVMAGSKGHICRVGLFKTVTRLGDSLKGFLDFRNITLPSFECTILSQTCEIAHPISTNESPEQNNLEFFMSPIDILVHSQQKASRLPEESMRKTWSVLKLSCSNVKFLPFSIPIPLSAPPEFLVKGNHFNFSIHMRWCLRFEFVVALAASKHTLSEDRLFDNFLQPSPSKDCVDFTNTAISANSQTFPWDLPITILPSGSSEFLFPCESRTTCLLPIP